MDETFSEKMGRFKLEHPDVLEEYARAKLRPSPSGERGKYCCPDPACPSGKSGRADSSGAWSVMPDGRRAKCFSCGRTWDIFDLIGDVEGVDGAVGRYEAACEFVGEDPGTRRRRTAAGSSSLSVGAKTETRTPPSEPATGKGERTEKEEGGSGGDLPPIVWFEDLTDADLREDPPKKAPAPTRPKTSPWSEEAKKAEAAAIRLAAREMWDPGHTEGVDYLTKERGLTVEEIERYGLGLNATHDRVVLPSSTRPGEYRHTDRAIRDNIKPKYKNPAGKKADGTPDGKSWAGSVEPWGLDALDESGAVFLTEGILSAVAVEVCGGRAVASNSADNWTRLYWAIIDRGYTGVLIALYDFDDAGRKFQAELAAALRGAGLDVLEPDGLPWGVTDPAECLKRGAAGRDALEEMVEFYLDEAEACALDRREREKKGAEEGTGETSAAEVEKAEKEEKPTAEEELEKACASLHMRPMTEVMRDTDTLADYVEPIPTGLAGLDLLLDGGLYAKNLTVLGGLSSFGKTTIALQVADHIAATGRPVLFVSVEQGAGELNRKSVSRIMWLRTGSIEDGVRVTPREINRPSKRDAWSERKRKAYEEAREEYAETIAPNMWVMESAERPTAWHVEEAAGKIAAVRGEAPVIFVDYLQLLGAPTQYDNERAAIEKNITKLRQVSRDMCTPVLCVSSVNRGSYSEGDMTMGAYKESGNIEYGADLLLGIQPYGIAEKIKKTGNPAKNAEEIIDWTREQNPRPLEIKVQKQREGGGINSKAPITFHCDVNAVLDGVDGKTAIWAPREDE